MEEIRPGVFIGDLADAKRFKGVTVNVSKVSLVHKGEIHIPLHDTKKQKKQFDIAVNETVHAIQAHDRVLVHCAVGCNRGPTVLATSLAWLENKSFEETLGWIEEERPFVNPMQEYRELANEMLEKELEVEKKEEDISTPRTDIYIKLKRFLWLNVKQPILQKVK